MDPKYFKILNQVKGKRTGIFCDGANLFYGFKKYGWQVDLEKLKLFFSRYFDLKFINYYLAIPAKSDSSFMATSHFISKISKVANIKSKELKYISVENKIIKKGNMDIEITLDIIRALKNIDVILLLSGDSDFYELQKYITRENHKNIIYIGYQQNMGWELRQCWHIFLEDIKNTVSLKKPQPNK